MSNTPTLTQIEEANAPWNQPDAEEITLYVDVTYDNAICLMERTVKVKVRYEDELEDIVMDALKDVDPDAMEIVEMEYDKEMFDPEYRNEIC